MVMVSMAARPECQCCSVASVRVGNRDLEEDTKGSREPVGEIMCEVWRDRCGDADFDAMIGRNVTTSAIVELGH